MPNNENKNVVNIFRKRAAKIKKALEDVEHVQRKPVTKLPKKGGLPEIEPKLKSTFGELEESERAIERLRKKGLIP